MIVSLIYSSSAPLADQTHSPSSPSVHDLGVSEQISQLLDLSCYLFHSMNKQRPNLINASLVIDVNEWLPLKMLQKMARHM